MSSMLGWFGSYRESSTSVAAVGVAWPTASSVATRATMPVRVGDMGCLLGLREVRQQLNRRARPGGSPTFLVDTIRSGFLLDRRFRLGLWPRFVAGEQEVAHTRDGVDGIVALEGRRDQ